MVGAMLGVRAAGAVMMSVLLLAACSGGDDEPEASPTTEATSATPPASPTPSPTPSVDAPASCTDLGLEAGADVEGRGLAACVTDALREAGSGVQLVEGDDLAGTVRFTWGKDVSYAAEMTSSDGVIELVSIPPRTWVKLGESWAEADAQGDPEQAVAADVGGLLAQAADPGEAVALLRGSSSWTVGDKTERLKRPDGSTVTAWRLTSSPFTADGAQVGDPVVWLDESFAPAGLAASVAADGTTTTTTRYFTDLGEPQDVTPPR